MKKILALVLALAMMVALCACGSSAPAAPAPAAEAPAEAAPVEEASAEAEEAPAEAAPISLVAWAWDKNVDSLIEAARLYNELTGENIEITVESISQGDIKNAIITANESGDFSALPDIILLEDTSFAPVYSSYPDSFFALTQYADWTQSAEAKAGLTALDGEHFGVPFDSGSGVALYRVDVLEQAGYSIADLQDVTWDEAFEIGADVYAKTGMYLFTDRGQTISMMVSSSGTALFNEDGSANVAENPAVIKSVETYIKGVECNAIYVSSDWNDYIASFTGGKVAAGVYDGCWIANNVNTAPDQAGLWDMAPLPRLDLEGATHYTNNGGSSWFVLTNSENPDAAAKMLGYMFAGEGMMDYVDYLTNDIGYITTYQPIAGSNYYDSINDGFYPEGFWTAVADTAAKAPIFQMSFLYSSAYDALKVAVEQVLAGTSIEEALATAQDTLDFEFDS